MRHTWILVPFLLVTATAQQTPPGAAGKQAESKAPDASAKKPSALEQLRAADEAGRSAALIKFVDAQIDTGAVYSGQYRALAKIGWDATPMLRAWFAKAPDSAEAEPAAFRDACLNAVRDCVEKAPEELITELEALVADHATPEQVVTKAKYALAQFGKTEHVDKMIESAKKSTGSTNVNVKVRAWSQLADVYYNIRRYEDAAKAHGAVITATESVAPNFGGLPANYYNCACSYALMGNKEAAMKHLTKSLELGARGQQMGVELLKTDMDIRSLRGEPAFAALMKKHFGIEPAKSAGAKDEADKQGADKR